MTNAPIGQGPYQKLYTHLSLARYARLLGIAPAHFWTGYSDTVFPSSGGTCDQVWWEYDWQNHDAVGRDSLLMAIWQAEKDIANVIGYSVAPEWISEEIVYPPKFYRKDYFGTPYDVQTRVKSFKVRNRRIIATGRRALTLIGTATTAGGTITILDLDADGFSETLRIILPTTLATTSEIKVYHSGYSGARGWELRNPRRKIISGGNVTIDFYTWQAINPATWEVFPTADGLSAIDMADADNLVTSLDVYREYTDTTQVSAQLYWDSTGPSCCSVIEDSCAECAFTTQDGCLHIRDSVSGYVAASPATYSAADAAWIADDYSICREPDFIKCWYYAGDIAPEYLNSEQYDPLSHYWAQAIAWIATARLERPPCSCSNIENAYKELSEETSKNITFGMMDNPFGTKKGEIMAWRRVQQFADFKGISI